MLQMLNHSRKQSNQVWNRLMIGSKKLICHEVHGAQYQGRYQPEVLKKSSPSWNQIALIMRNKPDIDGVIIDDLYQNLMGLRDEMIGLNVPLLLPEKLAFSFL
ncbi:hypothetical protein Tco_1428628 [Tanacetum coccineum]